LTVSVLSYSDIGEDPKEGHMGFIWRIIPRLNDPGNPGGGLGMEGRRIREGRVRTCVIGKTAFPTDLTYRGSLSLSRTLGDFIPLPSLSLSY